MFWRINIYCDVLKSFPMKLGEAFPFQNRWIKAWKDERGGGWVWVNLLKISSVSEKCGFKGNTLLSFFPPSPGITLLQAVGNATWWSFFSYSAQISSSLFRLFKTDFHLFLALAIVCARNILAAAISATNLPTTALKMDPGRMIIWRYDGEVQ